MCSLTKAGDPFSILPKDLRAVVADPLKLDPKTKKLDEKKASTPVTPTKSDATTLGIAATGITTTGTQPVKTSTQTNSVSAQLGIPG